MFEITLNNKTLYHPNALECSVINAVIHEKLNDAGYMDLTIPCSNPLYDEVAERNGKIVVYKDNVELWYGEIRDISVDFSKNKTLYIVGEAAYLNDTVQPQRLITGTKYQILQEILNHHNSMVDSDKEFQAGAIGNNANKSMEVVTDWVHSLDAIRELLCEENEYFKIRHINGVRYLDIMPLDTYGKRSTQDILFGDNLLDYSEESSGEKIATVCIPLGVKQDNGTIEGYESYLTCESANNGKNYVELQGAINRLGRITEVVHFNVLDTPQALLTAAINYLQSAQYAKLTLKLSAVDLSVLQSDIDNYSVGDYVKAICEPMGMNAWFPVRERDTDLINLANNKIVIGSESDKSFTAKQAETIDNIEKIMPNKDTILNAALKNASSLINANGENGNVSIRLDNDGKPYEILIMDDDNITDATRAWRWNLSGFGYGTKKAGDPLFTWTADVAMTMDGDIIAKKGNICGFSIDVTESPYIKGYYTNTLSQSANNGSMEIMFNEEYGTGQVEIRNGSYVTNMANNGLNTNGSVNASSVSASTISLNGQDLASSINALNSRCDSIANAVTQVYNLVRTLHGLP